MTVMPNHTRMSFQRHPTVVMLFPTWGPYHVARLRSCVVQSDMWNCVGLEVFGGSDGVFPKGWRSAGSEASFPIYTVFPGEEPRQVNGRKLSKGIFDALDSLKPAIVAIPAWSELWTLAALDWCSRNRIPAITLSVSTRWDKRRYWWKEAVKRRIVKGFQAALVGGAPQKEYLVSLGMESDSVVTGYNVVDNNHFRDGAKLARERQTQRADFGLPENYFLTVCRFTLEKNLLRLLVSYRLYLDCEPATTWDLVLVGEGPLRQKLINKVQRLGLGARVHVRSFASYDALPVYYGLARGFILPSVYEPWGLVVNEALISGLPVIVSERCGCARDLVQDKDTGLLINPWDTSEIAAAMAALSCDPKRAEKMRNRGPEVIEAWSPQAFGKSFWRAVDYAMNSRRTPPPSLVRNAYACWRLIQWPFPQ